MSFLTRFGKDKMPCQFELQILAIKIHTREDVSLKVLFIRGSEGEDSTEVINIARCINRVAKTFRFQTPVFSRLSNFYVSKGKVDDKKATLVIVKSQPGKADVELWRQTINITNCIEQDMKIHKIPVVLDHSSFKNKFT